MTTNTLAKHYDQLTPRERLPLIMAASMRDDEVERERLVNSAPRTGLRVANFFGFSQTVEEACFLYLLEQLDLAASYWRIEGLLESVQGRNDSPKRRTKKTDADQTVEDRLLFLVRWLAYRIVVNADAWQRLCGELNIETESMFTALPGRETLKRAEEDADIMAFDADEANSYSCRWQGNDGRAPTADEVLQTWRTFIDHRTKWWDTE